MRSGLQTLHEINKAIAKARKAINEVSHLPKQAAEAMIDLRRQQTAAYNKIAHERLELIKDGQGGEMGYVDRQAARLLDKHQKLIHKMTHRIDKAVVNIETLEDKRRITETDTQKAIDTYDKAAALAQKKILKDPLYMTALDCVETAENTLIHASEKLEQAKENETKKGEPYRKDPFFSYLQKRQYGTKQAKGWFLTQALDAWVASLVNYRETAQNYRRLQAIPRRLQNHVNVLEDNVTIEQSKLQELEAKILKQEGVTALHKASLRAQQTLEKIDEKIVSSEREYQELREEYQHIITGKHGPYKEAINLLSDALGQTRIKDIKRLTAQTSSRQDDDAIEDIIDLNHAIDELSDDQREAQKLFQKHEHSLRELEKIRQRFKSRRYDAPSSVFDNELIAHLLLKVLTGALDGDSLWRQIERAQRTIRRYSDNDFGGIDWSEGLRIPHPKRPRHRSRRRTSIPRAPRTRLPRMPRSSGGGFGGFRTGGGF